MAGSYNHCCKPDGSFSHDFSESLRDSHEACEEMHFMINHLAGGDKKKIMQAAAAFHAKELDEEKKIPISREAWDKLRELTPTADLLANFSAAFDVGKIVRESNDERLEVSQEVYDKIHEILLAAPNISRAIYLLETAFKPFEK